MAFKSLSAVINTNIVKAQAVQAANYKISSSGILDFLNYDVGYYKINILFTVNNI